MSTVTIITADGSISKKSPEFIKDKTVSDIFQSLFQMDDDQLLLAIKTPAYMKILHSDSIPYNIYPDLISDNSIDIDSIPDYFLQILNISEKGKFYFIFNPSSPTNPEIVFPLFTFGFVPSNYSEMPMSNFISDLVNHFGISISQPKLFLKNKEIPPDQNFNIFFHNASKYVKKCLFNPKGEKMKPLEFQFQIKPKGLKEIEFREIGLKEILDTEETYCNTLRTMNDYFSPLFQEQKILNQDDHQALFGPIPQMIETSVNFSTQISKLQSYASCVSPVFLKTLFSFKQTSLDYFVNYNLKISPIITTLDENPQIQKICDESPYNPGISFQSVVIQPIQRFPRYPLLLKELFKNTPESHPDFYFLPQVREKVESMVHELSDAHLVIKLNELKERLVESNNDSPIFSPERVLIKSFYVHLKEKKKNIFSLFESDKCNLYLFNDMILLTIGNEKEIEQMRCDIDKFVFIPNFPNNLSITFYNNDLEFKIIEFSGLDQIQIFKTELNDHRKIIFDSKEINILSSIKASEYFPVDDQIIHPMIDSSCCKHGNSIYAISHKNYHTYTTNGQLLSEIGSNKSIHDHSKLVIIDDNKYIFGGIKNVGPFEFYENKFVDAKPKNNTKKLELIKRLSANKMNDHLKESRIYHTCCAYDKYIVVFGGINPRNSKKEAFGMHFYSIETGEWFHHNAKIKPEPRYKHSAVIYKDTMIIHGGISSISNKLMKDTWSFNFLNGKWTLMELFDEKNNIVPRFGHSSVIVNNYMFVIGGLTSDRPRSSENKNDNVITSTNEEEDDDEKTTANNNNNNDKEESNGLKILKIINLFKRHNKKDKVKKSNDSSFDFSVSIESIKNSSLSFHDFDNLDVKDDDDYSFDHFDNDNDDEESDSSSTSSFSSKSSFPAPDCFCLNLENDKIETITIIGNFITGLSMFSCAYDELNKQIVVFGGRDPRRRMEKGLPMITLLDIPKQYTVKHKENDKKSKAHKSIRKSRRRSRSASKLKKSKINSMVKSGSIDNLNKYQKEKQDNSKKNHQKGSDEDEIEKIIVNPPKSSSHNSDINKQSKIQNPGKKSQKSPIQLSSSDDDNDDNNLLKYLKRKKIKTGMNETTISEKTEKTESLRKINRNHNCKKGRNSSVNAKKQRKTQIHKIKSKRRSSSIQNNDQVCKKKGSRIDNILDKY